MSDAAARTGMTDRTVEGIREALSGRMRWHSPLLFAGPAVIASIAYMDPGNFATNIQAGAKYGYSLLWVVLVANVVAMLYQALSAKLGIVTGRNLAEMCREHFPQPVVWALWIVSEVAAMATDLAEFLGGAIGLSLLLHVPLIAGMGVTAVLTYGILMFDGRGFRPIEIIIGALVAAIALCYLVEMFIAPIDWGAAGFGSVVPQLPDAGAVTIAVGIVGATIMPHAIFLHSGLTQNRAPARNDNERRQLLRFSNIEVLIALAVAGLVNMAMVVMAASAFHEGHSDVAEIETAYSTLTPLLGAGRGRRVPDRAAGVRPLELGGRHDGRPDDHAGFCRLPHPRHRPPSGDDDSGFHRRLARRQFDQRAGHEPGGAEHRAARAGHRAAHLHAPQGYHGRVRQQPADEYRRGRRRPSDPDAERHPAACRLSA